VKKKTVKLTWKKVSGKTKYQIQYSLNKKFRKGVKTKKTTKPNIKINRLSKKKKYYFRIRAINSAGIGKWSNVKKIVIRK
jgi:Fibronectin type III domain.